MGGNLASKELNSAADRVTATADEIRHAASKLVRRSGSEDDAEERRKAEVAADALGSFSDSLESLAEGARKSGLYLRDRGRDSARALERGERVLREGGFLGAGAKLAIMARRNAGGILAGAAAVTVLAGLLRRNR